MYTRTYFVNCLNRKPIESRIHLLSHHDKYFLIVAAYSCDDARNVRGKNWWWWGRREKKGNAIGYSRRRRRKTWNKPKHENEERSLPAFDVSVHYMHTNKVVYLHRGSNEWVLYSIEFQHSILKIYRIILYMRWYTVLAFIHWQFLNVSNFNVQEIFYQSNFIQIGSAIEFSFRFFVFWIELHRLIRLYFVIVVNTANVHWNTDIDTRIFPTK